MSKRTQAAMLETLRALKAAGAAPVVMQTIIDYHGLSYSEVSRLLAAMAKKKLVTLEMGKVQLLEDVVEAVEQKLEQDEIEIPLFEGRQLSDPFWLYTGPKSETQEKLIRASFAKKEGRLPTVLIWTGSAYLAGPATLVKG